MIFERIKKLCDERGISIAKLEQETGLGNATIRGWRESSPSVENLKRVADYLGVSLEELTRSESTKAQYMRIKKLCEKRGITVSELADECGLNRSMFSYLKKHNESLSGECLVKVARYLGVTTDYLLGLEPDPDLNADAAEPDPVVDEEADDEIFTEISGECSGTQVFCSEEFGRVRSMLIDGAPWFVGKDVADALGYANPLKAIRDHVDNEDKGVNEMGTPGGKQRVTIINESGLYSLILTSKLPSAKRFKRWVTSEVLPAIRKTGQYAVPEIAAPATPTITVDDCLAAARLLASCRADRLPLVVSLLDQAGFDIDQTRLPQRFTRPRQIEENYDYFQYADISLYLRDDNDD